MCDCFHLAFPNWHAASSGTRPGRRLQGPEPATEDSICDEPSQFTENERPRPQGSSPVEEYPETEKYSDSDKECEAEHDPHHKSGTRKKTKKSGLGSMFEKRSTPKMSKLKEVDSPESGLIVKTAKDGCAEGLVYGGGGKDGIFIKEVVPESPASKSLKLKEGDQILSATVYFDNMSYEDAIQILEHAQAYKLKLCLKRKPEITETEPATESHAIPEEDLYTPEMREKGKTKRRGEARISWPKFSSLGKGRKSHFIRSHSSSEADEQRKLELSPTTSDTESPIKTQDALKYKKKHKIKLSGLTKRGRISSSEDQDTDVPTTGQISSSIHQTQESDMLSPECLEMPEVYVTEDLKEQHEQSNQTVTEAPTIQHKVELISIDSTLKTADLTVALADQESPSGIKSPDGKKKKKERSELKMKILGKDKSHKKEAKAKSSPKRLKTLGASFELVDHPETEKSDLIPSFESHTKPAEEPALDAKVEHDVSDVTVSQKYPQISEANRQKGNKIKDKQGQTFKLPKVSLGEVATEEIRHHPYEKLAKSSDFRAQLPKREDIEIPGMEAASKKTTAKRKKEPKASYTGHNGDLQAETVQLSIDVDSVKEAVSKLPGYKLPKVDTSGMPIPEEITVIDANAQRISVKTPTKVVDTKTKHGANLAKFDATSSPEISKSRVKPPQFTTGQLTSEDLLTESKADFKKPEKEHEKTQKQGSKEMKTKTYEREDIIIPGKESSQEISNLQVHEADKTQGTGSIKFEYESDKKLKKAKMTVPSFGIAKPDIRIPDIEIDLPKQTISEQKGDAAKGEKTKFLQEVKMSKTEMKKGKGQTEGVVCEVMIPEIDGIEYIDSVDSSPAKKDDGIRHIGVGEKPNADISLQEIRSEVKKAETEDQTVKLLQFGATTPEITVNVFDGDKAISTDGAETKTLEREGKGSKFKMSNLGISMPKVKGPKTDSSPSKKDLTVTLPVAKAEVQLPEAAETDVTLGSVDIYIPMETEKHPETEGEFDRQGGKFKLPKLGIAMPKLKGPEVDFSLSQKNEDVKLAEAKMKTKPSYVELKESYVNVEIRAPEIKVVEKDAEETQSKFKMPTFKIPRFGSTMPNTTAELYDKNLKDTEIPETQLKSTEGATVDIPTPNSDIVGSSFDVKTTAAEVEGKGSKFKMPNLGFSKLKVKGPKIDLSLPKKDIGVTLPECTANVKLPKVDLDETDVSPPGAKKTDVKIPEGEVEEKLQEAHKIAVEVKAPEYEADIERHGGKFKMPTFGVKMTKTDIDVQLPDIKGDVKLPEAELGTDLSLSKKYVDVTPQTEIETKLTDAHKIDVSLGKAEVLIPQEKIEDEIEVHGSTFKLPKFGITMPKVNLGLSKKDSNITTLETNTDISLPDVELEATSLKVEIKAPETDVAAKDTKGSSSAFKMPDLSFSIPKIKGPDVNLSMPKKEADITLPATEPEVTHPESSGINISRQGTDILIPGAKGELKTPEVQVKPLQTDVDFEAQGAKFKMPEFGITLPKIKGPDIDLSFSKKDANVAQPGAEAEAEIPGTPNIAVDMKSPQCEAKIHEQGTKFKMPKFGITMPKVKGPDIDLKFSKKVDVKFPEAKAEVKLSDVELEKPSAEMEAPEIKGVTKDTGSSPTKFTMPTFKLPKFGLDTTSVTAEGQDMDKGVKIEGADISIPEEVLEDNIEVPSIELNELSVSMKTTGVEHEGKGSKFKLPSLGISVPQTKAPDIDLRLSKKDVDVTLPKAKAEVNLPEVELEKPSAEVEIEAPEIKFEIKDKKRSTSKFKMPTFKLPKFGFGTTSASTEVPDMDKDVKIEGADISIPEEVLEVNIKAPSIELKEPSIALKTTGVEHEGKASKFKFPSLGISVPQTKGPDIDLSLSKKDIDNTLPKAKADVNLPEVELEKPSAEVEIEAPEIKVEVKDKKGSPSKYKMPTFKLPKFGIGSTSVTAEVPDMEKGVKIEGAEISIPEEVLEVNIEAPSIELKEPSVSLKTTGAEHEGKGSKFKLPSLGISVPQTKAPDIDLSLSKKDVDVTLPKGKAEVNLPEVELEKPSAEMEIEAPEIKVEIKDKKGSPSKYKMPTFKLPKFGIGSTSVTAEVPDMDKGVKIEGVEISIPEEVLEVNIEAPSIELKEPSVSLKTTGVEHEGKGSKFKLPSLGISVPQTKAPDIDLSLSKKDVDVTLPKGKAEVKLSEVELEKPSVEVEIEAPEIKVVTKDKKGSPSKFTMPTFKLPKFGIGSTSVTAEVPDMDKGIKIEGAYINIPEQALEVNIEAPSIELKEPSVSLKTTGVEHEGKSSKFKLPSLGISVPQTKGPDVDLSLSKKDIDVTLPKGNAEVKLPEVELEKPSAEMEIEAPEIKVEIKDKKGSPSKYKMPTFKLPKFGIGSTSVTAEVPDVDKGVKIEGADISIPEEVLEVDIEAPSIELKEPSVSLKTPGAEHEGKGSKFKLPTLGISVPQTKAPDIDLSLSKKDVDVTLPKAKADVNLPEVELEKPSVEVEIEAPEIKVVTKDKKGSPSKFTMPTFKLPKFGIGSTSVTAEVPDMDKGVKIEGAYINIPEEVLEVNIEAPSIELKEPSVSLKTTGVEHEGKSSKFKLPTLGISVPQTKAPDIDLSLSKKDVDVTLPKGKAEVKLPEVELEKPSAKMEIEAPEIKVEIKDKKGSPSKYKMPTFKLPKFGIGSMSVTAEVPDVDKGVKIEGADISIPEEALEVDIEAPSIELKEPSVSLKTPGAEHEGKGSKFKLPSLGISVPQTKAPDIDLSLSKKDVDVTLPKAKADVNLPEVELEKPSAEMEIEAPEIKVEIKDKKGSPSKYKMPTFKLPKFGIGFTSVTAEVPDVDKGIKIEGADISIPEQALEVNIEAPSIELKEPSVSLKTTGVEHEGKSSKFKLPSLGISVPQTKGPDVDLSLSKKDVDVTLPKAKGEVKLPDVELEKPSAEVEIEAPEIKVEIKDKKGSPSKYKMPTFKLPKFGIGFTSVTAEVPDMDKGVKIEGADISIPEQALEVNIEGPCIELKEPSVSLKTTGVEHEGKGSKFKLTSLGISVPQTKGPDIDLSLSKKDVDVTLPKAKGEVKLPDVELEKPSAEVEIEAPEIKVEIKDKKGSPSKYKMPTFKLPKFGIGSTSVTAEVPDMDKGVKIEKADISIPEEVLEVHFEAPSIELKEPSVSLKTTGAEHEGKGSKFKLPSLGISVPQTKGPDIDLSLSKKDVDVTLPKGKGEVKLPDVELEKPSAQLEIEAPEIKVVTKDKKGSPSKFTMPTFKLPKFGIGSTSVTAEVPDMDKGVKIEGAYISIPEQALEVNIEAPSIELKEPSVSLETTGVEHEEKGSKFKLPSLGISVPQTKGPDVDLSLSKKDVDVTLPKAKAEVKLPDVELEKSSAVLEIEAPEIKVEIKDKKGSPSKYKMPTFKLPKFGIGSTSVTAEVPDMEKGVKIEGADISIPEEVLDVNIEAPSIELKEPSVSLKTTGAQHEAKGSKFKLPSLGISVPQTKAPDIDLSLSKKDVDVTLPKAKADVNLPEVELEKSSAEVEIEAPEIKVEIKDKKGSPSKFTMPTFKLPKFGFGSTSVTAEVPDMDKGVKIEGADISIPEEVLEVNIEAPIIELKEPSVSLETTGVEHEGKGSKFKLPSLGISVPQTKGPDVDLSLSKKDVDVTLPKAKADVNLPEVELEKPSAEMEIEAPEIKVVTKDKKGSPSKYKMPTFKLPKFGIGSTSVTAEVPDMDIEGADISIPEQALEVNIEAPSIELKEPSVSLKTTGVEHEGKGSKFKLPSLGISVPQTKGPDVDLSLSKKDVDVTLPKAKAEVKLPDVELEKPSAEVEIEAPEIKVVTKDKKGSPSKFTMPTFKLPKFGIGSTSVTAEVPDMDKGVKIEGADISIPEQALEVNIKAPSIELKEPSVSLKATGVEHEGKSSKFKLPSLGISVPQTKGPDVDLSLSKKDVDVTLPKGKAEVKLPDVELEKPAVEVEIEAPEIKVEIKDKKGSPSKYKMPTFKLPKFGIGSTSVTAEVPDMDKGVKIEGADISIPEEVLEVNIEAPSIELKEPSVSLKTTGAEHERKGSKFKLPSLGISVPQTKGPDIDLNLSRKDVDVTLPKAKAEVNLPDVELEKPSAEVEIEAPEIKVEIKDKKGSPSKFKMPTFKLPKFGISTTSVTSEVPHMNKGVKIEGADISIPEEVLEVNIEAPTIELKEPSVSLKTTGTEHEENGSKFKLPSLGISVPQTKGPDVDLSLSKKDVDVTLPKAKAEVQLPDAELGKPFAEVETETEIHEGNIDVSQSKLKMPTITSHKFAASISKVSVKVTDVDKEIKTDAEPSIDPEGVTVEVKAKGGELEVSGSKFKMPNLGIAMPNVKGPETDLSLSKKDVDVSLPETTAEVKLPHIEGKETEDGISVPEAPTIEVELKSKRPSWTFPKLSFSRTGDNDPDVDVNIETPKADIISTKAEVSLSDAEIKGPSMEQPPAAELDTNLKKRKFSLPRFSFSKSNIKEPELSDELPHAQVSVPEREIKVKHPGMEMKAPEQEAEQGKTFKFPKFGIVQTKAKVAKIDFNASKNNVDTKLLEIKAEVKISEDDVKQCSSETEAKSKDAGGSPLKIKIPPLKMPKFSSASYDVTTEAPEAVKVIDTDGSKLKEDVSASEKDLSVNVKMDDFKGTISDSETPKTEPDCEGHGSPSKFKLPSFKMPKLSFSKPKPEEEILPADTEDKEDQLEMEDEPKGEGKSPQKILTSFGEILKTIDVEFDVPKADKVEGNLVVSKEVQEIDEPTGKKLEAKAKETIIMQDTSKSPERTGWFTFPRFGLSSPSEPPNVREKDEQKDKKSPVGGTEDEEISPTCSVQSSDAFADISSTITSEYVDPSISPPTTVTVKYSDPNVATGLGETHSNIITSTTRTELISVEPNLAEKITILSSGISSSSEDTIRLDSGKIHVVTTNIQATPEAQHAKLLTDIEGELAGGFPLKSEADETASWTVEDSKSGNRTVFERHIVKKTSSERSESRETIVITKQITHVLDSSEPISGETASSIQRLRDSVHSEKMRFFDDAEK